MNERVLGKMDYAKEVANRIGKADVMKTEKGIGVQIDMGWEEIRPIVYIDAYYDEYSPSAAANIIMNDILAKAEKPQLEYDVDIWENVKSHIVAELTKEPANKEIYTISAKKFGFDDLYISFVAKDVLNDGRIRITKTLVEKWEVKYEDLLFQAWYNEEFELTHLNKRLSQLLGRAEEDLPENPIWIVSNQKEHLGAIAIIYYLDDLKEMFPEGFYVIPSSVHEVLVIPKSQFDISEDALNRMIIDVNETQLKENEVLSDHFYKF